MFEQEPFLYLTTIGWKTQNPHEIEIWFVYHEGCFYLISEKREKSHWVQNLPKVRPKPLDLSMGM
ncbi:MAG: hypothetical protein CUN55_12050 [Phototrophicales bacterium]|nr:MAG: hypothetical protein CUN55_12050 [Phototrophicales bacterium]